MEADLGDSDGDIPVHHVGHELHLSLNGGDLLGRRGLRAAKSKERHAGRWAMCAGERMCWAAVGFGAGGLSLLKMVVGIPACKWIPRSSKLQVRPGPFGQVVQKIGSASDVCLAGFGGALRLMRWAPGPGLYWSMTRRVGWKLPFFSRCQKFRELCTSSNDFFLYLGTSCDFLQTSVPSEPAPGRAFVSLTLSLVFQHIRSYMMRLD